MELMISVSAVMFARPFLYSDITDFLYIATT